MTESSQYLFVCFAFSFLSFHHKPGIEGWRRARFGWLMGEDDGNFARATKRLMAHCISTAYQEITRQEPNRSLGRKYGLFLLGCIHGWERYYYKVATIPPAA